VGWNAVEFDRLQPIWTRLAGGCHPNRDTEGVVQSSGFQIDRESRRARDDMRRFVARPRPAGSPTGLRP
jgi:hypothetical protein